MSSWTGRRSTWKYTYEPKCPIEHGAIRINDESTYINDRLITDNNPPNIYTNKLIFWYIVDNALSMN